MSACGYEHNKQSTKDAVPEITVQDEVGFVDVQQAVFLPKCQRCHSGEGLFTFDDHEVVSAMLGEIEHRALTLGDMPPRGPLESREKAILQAWIAAGGPL